MNINNHIKPTIEQEKSCKEKGMPNCQKKICDCITFAQSYTCQKLYEYSNVKDRKINIKRK